MREVEADYLVVGAGASGMAFADTLVAHTDAEVVLVDRLGPWNAASRLNLARAALDHIDDEEVAASLAVMIEHTRDALKNLQRAATAAAPEG